MPNKGSFNAGWWNCFDSFTAELAHADSNYDTTAYSVMSAAGVSRKEAAWHLEHGNLNPTTEKVVREYWLHCK